ncbi:MAG: hypothetical protein ACREPJ_14100 [Rhodanobacteraceae bacterium]
MVLVVVADRAARREAVAEAAEFLVPRAREGRIEQVPRGRQEQQGADAGDDEARDDAEAVTEARQYLARGQRHQEIRAEEGELHQHHARVVEREQRLQVRDQHVVQDRDEAPHEEHGGHHHHRGAMAGDASG